MRRRKKLPEDRCIIYLIRLREYDYEESWWVEDGETFLNFGYISSLRALKNICIPYRGEILFWAEELKYYQAESINISKLIRKLSKEDIQPYKPKDRFAGDSRCYCMETLPIFREIFKSFDGYEIIADHQDDISKTYYHGESLSGKKERKLWVVTSKIIWSDLERLKARRDQELSNYINEQYRDYDPFEGFGSQGRDGD